MNLSSVNVDVLLYLMKFVHPDDRFNLALSGVLKGFENINRGIDLDKRVECCEAELGLRHGSMCELEIRSLMINGQPDESLLKILEQLAGEGYLQNNPKLHMRRTKNEIDSRIVELICSMKNLESLVLLDYRLSPEVLAHVFRSCSKITHLHLMADTDEMPTIDERLKNQLRPGFQRLHYLHIQCYIEEDTWLVLQEMLTWLKECVELSILNESDHVFSMPLDSSLVMMKSLKIADFTNVPAALVKWILSTSLSIHTLSLGIQGDKLNSLLNEIGCLEKLTELTVRSYDSSALIEIVRSCRHVEILRMNVTFLTLSDLTKLQPAENKTDFTLRWNVGPFMKEVFPVLKRWRQLRRLTLDNSDSVNSPNNIFPPFEVLDDFIMGMNYLSHLHIVPHRFFRSDVDQLEILRDKVNELILPRRPNFKFDTSRSDY